MSTRDVEKFIIYFFLALIIVEPTFFSFANEHEFHYKKKLVSGGVWVKDSDSSFLEFNQEEHTHQEDLSAMQYRISYDYSLGTASTTIQKPLMYFVKL